MSDSSIKRSDEFLAIADQFKLGVLVTESSHPVTANLSEVARKDTSAALGLLFDADRDVIRKYREWAESDAPSRISREVLDRLREGGRILFTGCGSTGRLSILLDSVWRDFWQTHRDLPDSWEWENRTLSVMAGGDFALIKSVEGFEDYTDFGRKQIDDLNVGPGDVVFAITEGGETSFVIGTAWKGVEAGAKVYFVYNNPDDILCEHVQRGREVIEDPRIEKINLTTGPMAITGSTRMQATTIQLCVMLTLLEMVIRELVSPSPVGEGRGEVFPSPSPLEGEGRGEGDSVDGPVASVAERSGAAGAGSAGAESVPQEFLRSLIEMHASLRSRELLAQLARLVAMEETVYHHGHKNNYFAGRLGIDVLTDTTERSPTYCTPPFRKFDDPSATESWSFLFVPSENSEAAWKHILKRELRTVDWTESEVRALVSEESLERVFGIVQRISTPELMKFRIGLDGLEYRKLSTGDSAVAILAEQELDSLLSEDGFAHTHLEHARASRARTGLVFFGSEESIARAGQFATDWNPECISVLVPVPQTDLLLDGVTRVGVKMLLNALSTCTMVRLGRVMGNYMIYVVPSNLKLIDRATRYISQLTGLPYQDANRLLFEVIEYVEPRMKSDQAYPPVVGLAVTRHKQAVSNEDAEAKLAED